MTDDMPAQPKTTELPAADPVLIGIADLAREMRGVRADIALVSSDLGIVKARVTILESHRNDSDERAARTSNRVEQASEADLAHESKLAAEIVARGELAAKVDALNASQELQLAILGRLDKIATNPHIKLILAVLATAAMSWAASKGLK